MLPEVEKLLRVQHHDQKLASLTKELDGIPLEEEDIRDKLSADQKALEEAIFAMFNKIVDAIKEDVKQRVADSLDVPKWAQDFADGLKKK